MCVCIFVCIRLNAENEKNNDQLREEQMNEWRNGKTTTSIWILFVYFYLKAKKMRFSFSFANVHTKQNNYEWYWMHLFSIVAYRNHFHFEHIQSSVLKECNSLLTLVHSFFLFAYHSWVVNVNQWHCSIWAWSID